MDMALGVAVLVSLVVAATIDLVWMGLALGALLRKLGGPRAHAWVPVLRWIAAAREGRVPVVPVAIARSIEFVGALAATAAYVVVLSADTLAPVVRIVLIVSLLMWVIGGLTGWVMWIYGAGTIELRMRAPRALTWLAAIAPAIWASVLGWGSYRASGYGVTANAAAAGAASAASSSSSSRPVIGREAPAPSAPSTPEPAVVPQPGPTAPTPGAWDPVLPPAPVLRRKPAPAPEPEPAAPSAPETSPAAVREATAIFEQTMRREPAPKARPEPAPEPAAKPAPQPQPQPQPEPAAASAPEPAPQPEPEPAPQPQRQPEPAAASAPEPEPEPAPASPPDPDHTVVATDDRSWVTGDAGVTVAQRWAGFGAAQPPVAESEPPAADSAPAPAPVEPPSAESAAAAPAAGAQDARVPILPPGWLGTQPPASQPASDAPSTQPPAPTAPSAEVAGSPEVTSEPEQPVTDNAPGTPEPPSPSPSLASPYVQRVSQPIEAPPSPPSEPSPLVPPHLPPASAPSPQPPAHAESPLAPLPPSGPEEQTPAATEPPPETEAMHRLPTSPTPPPTPAPAVSAPAPVVPEQAADVAAADFDSGDDDHTVIATRRRETWVLQVENGASYALGNENIVLGRATAAAIPGRLGVDDPTRTVSKLHAELEPRDGGWWVRDLGSTNGTYLRAADGSEHEVGPAGAAVDGDLILGDLVARVVSAKEGK